ncbi:MAG: EAL domain-containing protein, partial [Candidatus Limnocylindrales bacterium]
AALAAQPSDGQQRRRVGRLAAGHHAEAIVEDPAALPRAIIRLLEVGGDSALVLLVRFDAHDEPIVVAASSAVMATSVDVVRALPAVREALVRAWDAREPWVGRWPAGPDDVAVDASLAGAGVTAAGYLPLSHGAGTIGLVIVGLAGRAEDGLGVLAERMPILAEVANLAGSLLGPEFARIDARAVAAIRLDRILASAAFRPVFQPISELATGRVVGCEALTRFEGTTPDEVFAEATLLGRLQDLEVATLAAALEAAERLPPDRWLSVNVSATLLADTATLRRLIGQSLRPIVLELSEHELVHDYRPLTTSMKRMAPFVTLAIDDAGAGFSSLRHILEASPSWVKLDIGLVRGVDRDPARQALVAGLVHFAQRTGIALIAEGIETASEVAMLRSLGVSLGQGFFLARPTPIDEKLIRALAER